MHTINKDISQYFISGNIETDVKSFNTYAKEHILNYSGISYSSSELPDVDFIFNGQPLQQNEDQLNAALNDFYSMSFELLKTNRKKEIDAKTASLIYLPATFDGHQFSMSDVAQRNWIAIKASIDIYEAMNLWPVPVTCEPDDQYLLLNAQHATQFAAAMLFSASAPYNSGRALKLQISAATTKAEIDAIIDNR